MGLSLRPEPVLCVVIYQSESFVIAIVLSTSDSCSALMDWFLIELSVNNALFCGIFHF